MKFAKWGIPAIGLVVAATLSGCGGSGGGSSNNSSAGNSPYSGSYTGQFDSSGTPNQTGEIAYTIDSNGKIAGTLHNDTYSLDGTVSGAIDNSGNTNFTFVYPTNGTYTATGKLLVSGKYLSGQIEEYSGSSDLGAVDISVTKS